MGTRGTGKLATLVLLLSAALFPTWVPDAHAQQPGDRPLPGCGICYPGGYDHNTVGSLQGTLLEVHLPDEGPVSFLVSCGGERWVILASPTWYWVRTDPGFVPGDVVTVRGSKTLGADGNLYLVAEEMRRPGAGAVAVVRDRRGVPLWRPGPRGAGLTDGASGDGASPGSERRRGVACRP